MRSPLIEPLYQLAGAWRSATGPSRRRIAVAFVAFAWVLALLATRYGTGRARLAAAAGIVLSAAAAVGWRVVDRRRLRAPEGIVRELAQDVDPDRAGRALRALSLIDADGDVRAEGTSAELARIHVRRVLADLPAARITDRASRLAARVQVAAIVVGVCALGLAFAKAWSVLEGADVLFARGGVAPFTMRWLDHVEVTARPPDYLHEGEVQAFDQKALSLPYGALVTFRGAPQHPGRRLFLTDGTTEVPFVEDGEGGLVARWPLTKSVSLQAVARFGGVIIPGPDAFQLTSIADELPIVILEGAPRQVRLAEATEDIPIRYDATDDHGLREVHLVLRSGVHEERRVLSHLDGEARTDKGGLVLKLRDAFLRKSHAPVEVVVEAKDNDVLLGPKWGASAAVTIIPPEVGEPEALRLRALRAVRDALVDTLAWRLSNDLPGDRGERSAWIAEDQRRTERDGETLEGALAGTYAGVRPASRLRALLLAQQQKTRKAVDAEARAPTAASRRRAIEATEHFVLVADAVVRGLGEHDARDTARQLVDVADDLAIGAAQARTDTGGTPARAEARMDAATTVLTGGARSMSELGALGRDIGEIVDADLARVARARGVSDLIHAELAARDLAARLRQPDPSFGSRGGGGRAGGESGGAHGTPGDQGQGGDDVQQAFDEAAQDLERLSHDHANGMSQVEQSLAGATGEEDKSELRDEGRRHAQAIRDAVRDMPSTGLGSDSWTSKGAAARELAEQMARALEDGHPDEAAQTGQTALGALDEAKKMLQKGSWYDDPRGDDQKRVDDARHKLDTEQKWAEDKLRQLRQRAAEAARGELERGGREEGKLADRAKNLAGKARDKGSFPDSAVDSIEDAERAAREAAQALQRGDAEQGMEKQREAQRRLDAALEQIQQDDDDTSSSASSREGDGKATNGSTAIPGPNAHKGPEEFRRRVVRGLARPTSDAMKDAVRRYAEGLLR